MNRLGFATLLGASISLGMALDADARDRPRANRPYRPVVERCEESFSPSRRARSVRRARHVGHVHCGCRQVHVPGYHKVVYDTVHQPGCYERVWIPARYGYVRVGCTDVRRLVSRGHYEQVWRPGHTRRIARQVWVAPTYRDHKCRRHA